MSVRVTCEACGHPADLQQPSSTWRCNCRAGVSDDPECDCAAVNDGGAVEDNPTDASGEITDLENRLAVLRGGVRPEGTTTDDQ